MNNDWNELKNHRHEDRFPAENGFDDYHSDDGYHGNNNNNNNHLNDDYHNHHLEDTYHGSNNYHNSVDRQGHEPTDFHGHGQNEKILSPSLAHANQDPHAGNNRIEG